MQLIFIPLMLALGGPCSNSITHVTQRHQEAIPYSAERLQWQRKLGYFAAARAAYCSLQLEANYLTGSHPGPSDLERFFGQTHPKVVTEREVVSFGNKAACCKQCGSATAYAPNSQYAIAAIVEHCFAT
eukprot:2158182-Pleurochrysis_carterae.AAC.2